MMSAIIFLTCTWGATGQAGLRVFHSIYRRCKHDRRSVRWAEREYVFDWWGHDLSVLSNGRKRAESWRKRGAPTHYVSHDILRKHPWSQVTSTIDNKPMEESARLFFLKLTRKPLCLSGFRQRAEEFNFVEENLWHELWICQPKEEARRSCWRRQKEWL